MLRIPLSWLREYVAIDVPAAALAERLAVASCEVERVVPRGVPDVDGNRGLYRVGRVLEAGKHPNADRLQLCRVDVGEGEPRQIVCGAWNFGAGATVPVALPGAVLPDGRRLERAKLRGEVSEGMILSERELELSQEHAGILVLAEPHEPGTPLADLWELGDEVLEIEVTGNRPDLMSVYGMAREVAALYDLELAPPPGRTPAQVGDERVDVTVLDFEGCPRFIGRLFRDVKLAESPPWLKARLSAAGMRPISNVVDITNYVMLCLGNPTHAYDRTKLAAGRIVVRRAHAGETIRTLDDTLRELDHGDLLITDGTRPVGVAGIMGSLDSEIADTTSEVLFEVANFEPHGILRSSERLRLRTEGSNRWEKGVDPYLAEQAAALGSQLLAELGGGRLVGSIDVNEGLPEPPRIRYRPARADALVGVETPEREQRGLFARLGCTVDPDWTVTVPTWRARDLRREVDLVEEVARVALDRVPFTLPTRQHMAGRLTPGQRLRRTVEDVLAGCGFSEAYTSSLVAETEEDALRLPEPLSAEQAVLRTSIVPSLVESAARNLDAGNEGVALFELARVYLPTGEQLPDERWRVAGIVEGGFFAAKGAVETLYGALKVEPRFERGRGLPLLHPGKTALLPAGFVGELRPDVLEGAWGVFELDLATLLSEVPALVIYEDVIAFPAVKQDLAFVVDERVPAGDLVTAAREAAGERLRTVSIFDVYHGEQVGQGQKSVALRVEFRAPDRTLSDEDATELRARIVAALSERFGATLRA